MHPQAEHDLDLKNRIRTHFHGQEEPLSSEEMLCCHAPEILRHSADIIDQRGQQRDSPNGERSMARAIKIYEAITGIRMTESDGWLFMVALKLARIKHGYNPDDTFDAAAYLALRLESLNRRPE